MHFLSVQTKIVYDYEGTFEREYSTTNKININGSPPKKNINNFLKDRPHPRMK